MTCQELFKNPILYEYIFGFPLKISFTFHEVSHVDYKSTCAILMYTDTGGNTNDQSEKHNINKEKIKC